MAGAVRHSVVLVADKVVARAKVGGTWRDGAPREAGDDRGLARIVLAERQQDSVHVRLARAGVVPERRAAEPVRSQQLADDPVLLEVPLVDRQLETVRAVALDAHLIAADLRLVVPDDAHRRPGRVVVAVVVLVGVREERRHDKPVVVGSRRPVAVPHGEVFKVYRLREARLERDRVQSGRAVGLRKRDVAGRRALHLPGYAGVLHPLRQVRRRKRRVDEPAVVAVPLARHLVGGQEDALGIAGVEVVGEIERLVPVRVLRLEKPPDAHVGVRLHLGRRGDAALLGVGADELPVVPPRVVPGVEVLVFGVSDRERQALVVERELDVARRPVRRVRARRTGYRRLAARRKLLHVGRRVPPLFVLLERIFSRRLPVFATEAEQNLPARALRRHPHESAPRVFPYKLHRLVCAVCACDHNRHALPVARALPETYEPVVAATRQPRIAGRVHLVGDRRHLLGVKAAEPDPQPGVVVILVIRQHRLQLVPELDVARFGRDVQGLRRSVAVERAQRDALPVFLRNKTLIEVAPAIVHLRALHEHRLVRVRDGASVGSQLASRQKVAGVGDGRERHVRHRGLLAEHPLSAERFFIAPVRCHRRRGGRIRDNYVVEED